MRETVVPRFPRLRLINVIIFFKEFKVKFSRNIEHFS